MQLSTQLEWGQSLITSALLDWLLSAQTLTQKFVQEFEKWLQNPTNLQKEKLGFDFYPENSYGEVYFNRRSKS